MLNDELLAYEAHPVSPYDPHYTRDMYLFRCVWDDYVSEMRNLVAAARSRIECATLFERYISTIAKIHKFEKVTNVPLISYTDSSGRMRQNRSYLKDLL